MSRWVVVGDAMFPPRLMKHRSKLNTVTFRMWGIPSFARGMVTLTLTASGERLTDDRGGGSDDSGFLDGLAQGFGNN